MDDRQLSTNEEEKQSRIDWCLRMKVVGLLKKMILVRRHLPYPPGKTVLNNNISQLTDRPDERYSASCFHLRLVLAVFRDGIGSLVLLRYFYNNS